MYIGVKEITCSDVDIHKIKSKISKIQFIRFDTSIEILLDK